MFFFFILSRKIDDVSIGADADADFSPQILAKICVFALIIYKLFYSLVFCESSIFKSSQ